MTLRIAAVVLAGGEGRRMGGCKPLRAYGGSPLVVHAVNLARRWTDDVVIAVREAAQIPEPPVSLIVDPPNVLGPAAGLKTALSYGRERGAEAVLTLPCDAPRLPADLVHQLGSRLAPDGACVLASSGGRLHPTCGLWRVRLEAPLAEYLSAGGRSLRGFAAAVGAGIATWPLDDDGDPFANANTPEELAALQPQGAPR